MSSPRISVRGAGARSRARAKRPKAVPCAARTAAHGSLVVPSVLALARRGGGRGARSTATKERAPQLHARQDAETVPALQRRVGDADASAEERPGAALVRADAGSRSAGSEHRRRVRRRVRERRDQALQRPRGARTARPRRCRPNLLGRRARRSERSAKRRRCPGGARGRREAERSASCPPAPAQWPLGWGRDTARARGRSEEGPLARAVWSARPLPRPARRSRRGRFRSTAPAGAVRCSAPGGLLVDRSDTIPRSARSGRSGSTRTTTPRTSTKRRRLWLRAEGRSSCRSSRVAPAGAPAPRRSRPVNPRRVASLRPRAAFGPRRTAVARKPSALGLTRTRYVPCGSAARGRPLRPPGPRAARPHNGVGAAPKTS